MGGEFSSILEPKREREREEGALFRLGKVNDVAGMKRVILDSGR